MLFNWEIWALFDEPVALCQSDDKQMLRLLSTVWQTLKGKENHLNSRPSERGSSLDFELSQTHFHRSRAAAAHWLGLTGTDVWVSICVWSSRADLVHLGFLKAAAVSTITVSSVKTKEAYSTETNDGFSPGFYACLRWRRSVLRFGVIKHQLHCWSEFRIWELKFSIMQGLAWIDLMPALFALFHDCMLCRSALHLFSKGGGGEDVEEVFRSMTQNPDDQSGLIELTEKCQSQEVEMNERRHVQIGEFWHPWPINQTRTFPLGHIPLNLHNVCALFNFRQC